jgi:hypothetical protein
VGAEPESQAIELLVIALGAIDPPSLLTSALHLQGGSRWDVVPYTPPETKGPSLKE